MDTTHSNGADTLSNGVDIACNGLSNGTGQEDKSHKWVYDVTRKGISKNEVLHGYKQWVNNSDYETVKNSLNQVKCFVNAS